MAPSSYSSSPDSSTPFGQSVRAPRCRGGQHLVLIQTGSTNKHHWRHAVIKQATNKTNMEQDDIPSNELNDSNIDETIPEEVNENEEIADYAEDEDEDVNIDPNHVRIFIVLLNVLLIFNVT